MRRHVVPLERAASDSRGAEHSFVAGIVAINGGRMNCFDRIRGAGPRLTFIEMIFDVRPLTPRDRDADDLLGAFDFREEPLEPLLLEERACG